MKIKAKHIRRGLALLPHPASLPVRIVAGVVIAGGLAVRRRKRRKQRERDTTWAEAARLESLS